MNKLIYNIIIYTTTIGYGVYYYFYFNNHKQKDIYKYI